MRFTSLFPLACLLLLAVLSTAWQLEERQMEYGQLLPRQRDSSDSSDSGDQRTTTSAEDATTGASPTAEETASSTSSSGNDSEQTDSATSSATRTTSVTRTTSGSHSTTTSHSTTRANRTTSVDPRLPPGGISMITPNALSTTYYKINEKLTFVWNYTSLSITPSAINVIASCSLNDATYTIASNMSVTETQSVVWDTEKYQANATVPLLTATYTLIVYDESKDIDDIAKAGELSSQFRYYFGMYSSQPYQDLDNWQCATCGGAVSAAEIQGLKVIVGVAVITVASFTWFATGFGVFST